MQKTTIGIYSLIFFTFFYILILSSSGFLLNIPINKAYLPVSFLLGVLTTFFLLKEINKVQFIKSIISFLGIALSSYFLSIHFYDFSWDGMAYHQDAIVKLANGWIPTKGSSGSIFAVWIDTYQKGVEYIQASIYIFTGKIESGKLYNIMLLIAVSLMTVDTLKIYITSLFNRIALTFITVFCPVVVAQLLTYYIDFTYYLLTISIICNLFLIFKYNTKYTCFLLVVTSVLICNVKFSTVPTFVVFCFFIMIYLLWKKKKEFIKPIFINFSIVFLLCIITNFSPFILNLSEGKHVFHPLMGAEKIEIIDGNIPPYMLEKDRFSKFFLGTFSVATNQFQTDNNTHVILYEPKIPFSIEQNELEKFNIPDLRLSGFGIYYSGIFILTVIILISVPLFYFLDKRKRLKPQKSTFEILYFIIAVLSVSIIINPEMWWARYVPQLWLISILSLLIIWKLPIKYFKVLKYFLFFSVFFNIIIHSFQVFSFQTENNEKVNIELKRWKEDNIKLKIDETYFVNVHLRLKENNIPYSIEKINEEHFYMPGTYGQVKLQEISNIKSLETINLSEITENPDASFYDFLNSNFNETIILSAKDEASLGLSLEEKENIKQNLGLNLKDLGYRGSYVAVISNGKIVLEEVKNDKTIEIKNNPDLTDLGISKITSSGFSSGNFSSIRMHRSELSLNKRGINVVLIKNNQTYLLNIDSYQTNKLDPNILKVTFKEN